MPWFKGLSAKPIFFYNNTSCLLTIKKYKRAIKNSVNKYVNRIRLKKDRKICSLNLKVKTK